MTVSIIIAVKTWVKNSEECVTKCLELDYPDFEILILPDEPFDSALGSRVSVLGEHREPSAENRNKGIVSIQIIPTGPIGPAQKRDRALSYAQGEILAFLDDDAYPAKDWLKQAVLHFTDENVAAVGGPGVTPREDNLRQQASGRVYSSILVSGRFVYRYTPKATPSTPGIWPKPKKMIEVDDFPSCNFLIRKNVFQELSGFNVNFWPGEDTKLCLEITKKLGKKIIYEPKALVFHHRRQLFMPHIRQIANYALHRGYFVKKYPQTSLRFVYFLPGIFVAGLLSGGIISLFSASLRSMYFWLLSFYALFVILFSFSKNLLLMPMVFLGIICTHLTYGIFFLKGLFLRNLPEESEVSPPQPLHFK